METLRIKTDATVIDKEVGIGYVLYERKDGDYHEILRNGQLLEASYDSQKAEEIAIVRGLSVAQEHYSGGTVAAMTDCQGIVDRVRNRGVFSHNKKICSSLSAATNPFEEVMIKWIPSDENTVAHKACRSVVE